jgi:small nuclear ribonucleoprotein D3
MGDFGLWPKFERNSLILSDLCHHEIRISKFRFRPRIVGSTNRVGSIGIPSKLIHQAQGHVVTVELTSGLTYRGKLVGAEDTCNIQLENVLATDRTGRVNHWNSTYIRGSHVRFFVIPVMLRYAPMFQIRAMRTRGK